MQFLCYVLLQIDEAFRLIQDGRLAQLRIALLLLDNAAEIQMKRFATDRLSYEETQERLKSEVLSIPEDKRTPTLQDLVLWQPLSTKEKRAVRRYFDEKVRYLAERAKEQDSRLAAPLWYLHQYRNEAYHHAKVRKETIETAANLLLDINCELLLNLSRSWTSYASNEDYSWLEERFYNGAPSLFHKRELVPQAVEDFQATVDLDDASVAQLLVRHLESLIQDVFDALVFMVQNTRCPDRETAIRDSHGFGEARRKQRGLPQEQSEDAMRRHSVNFLNRLRNRVPQITSALDRFESFRQFSALETDFEVVEENVQELAAEVDGWIQM
jgi:hypothetical protein